MWKSIQVIGAFLIAMAIFLGARLLPDIENWKVGLIMAAMGGISLIGQFLVPKNRPATASKWSGRQQKTGMIVSGTILVIFGTIVFFISR